MEIFDIYCLIICKQATVISIYGYKKIYIVYCFLIYFRVLCERICQLNVIVKKESVWNKKEGMKTDRRNGKGNGRKNGYNKQTEKYGD